MDKGVVKSEMQDAVKRNSFDSASASPLRLPLKVSAYLKYDDGTLSAFDVLNDKSIALWNTIIGEGDAMKPSKNTVLKLIGNLDGISIKVNNGNKLVIDTIIIHSDKYMEYVIKETGCAEIYVKITKNRIPIYNDTIPFHCGE